MKNLLIILFVTVIITGCKKEESKCRPYIEAVRDGTIPKRTTTVSFTDSLAYELDYVKDQNYKDYPHFCFGYKELNAPDFEKVLKTVVKRSDSKNIYRLQVFAEGADICNNAVLSANQIKYLMVHYIAKDNTTWFDFINVSTNKTESHRDSGAASVYIYFLMKRTDIAKFPSITQFRDIDFNIDSTIKPLDRKDDPLYPLANPKKS